MRTLVIVDMQKDFIDGALGTKEAAAIVPRVVEKIRKFDGTIIVTKDTHYNDYLNTQEGKFLPVPHCIYLTDGWELHKTVFDAIDQWVKAGGNAEVFTKKTFGSVEMADYLSYNDPEEKLEEVIFIGLCTDICVISNALLLKAFLPEVKVTVDAACCAGVTPESHENALKAMKMCQINIENWEEG